MKLDHIDSMRGLAILMVVFAHASGSITGLSLQAEIASAFAQLGVQLFFIASAFTLCHSAMQRSGEAMPLLSFAIRRYFRIAPMYYIGIPLYLSRSLLKNWTENHVFEPGAQYTLSNILANVFLIHGFVPDANNEIVLGGWSIGTEVAFYVLFPALLAGFLRINGFNFLKAVAVFVGTVVLSQIVLSIVRMLTGMQVSELSFMYFNIANQLPVFILGMCLFFLVRHDQWPVRNRWANLAGFVAFLALCMVMWLAPDRNFSAIPIVAAISYLFLFKVLEAFHALNPAFLRSVGKVSFSMYILHFFFAYKLTRTLGNVLAPKIGAVNSLFVLFVVAAMGSYLAAMITYRLVELPFIGMGKRLISRLRSMSNGATPRSTVL